jgi:putative lipase involved disintegration of autophagic bodies
MQLRAILLLQSFFTGFLFPDRWKEKHLNDHFASSLAPNMENKTEILGLAELAANAYLMPQLNATWRNSTDLWMFLYSYGWRIDGVRGHVFKHREKPVIAISVKGTSLNSKKDKESANLICSCNCCFQNCTSSACDKGELLASLPNMYLTLVIKALADVKERYPDFSIWFTGHSMGAVVAALAGVQSCNHAVGFASPGEQLFAERINLTHGCTEGEPLGKIHHVGYYKDPIFTGTCGWMCRAAGYRMDSKCHHGAECVYTEKRENPEDPKDPEDPGDHHPGELGSGLIWSHTINFLIDRVIVPNEHVPKCIPVLGCNETCTTTGD